MATVPSRAPSEFRQGTTVKWTLSTPDYLPADGWSLSYRFARADATATIVATDNGDGTFLVTIPASGGTPPTTYDSTDFPTGLWSYIAIASKAAEAFEVDHGSLTVLPTLTAVVETRSIVKQTLDAIEAEILARAGEGPRMAAYSIDGRSASFTSVSFGELLVMRDSYAAAYRAELAAENLAKGLGDPRRIGVRCIRA